MAGPIRISVLADASAATKSVSSFASTMDGKVTGAADRLSAANDKVTRSSKDLGAGFDAAGDGADRAEQRAMGFRDTMTGVQDAMGGVGMIAKGDLFTGFLTLGMGVGDLASGFANFLIPAVKAAASGMLQTALSTTRATIASGAHKVAAAASVVATGAWTAAQWLLNAALSANPIALVVIGIAALIAAVVLAWKHSETFRRIVTGAFNAVKGAASAVWNWVKSNWPLLLAIITGPIGAAVLFVVRNFDTIKAKIKAIPGWVKSQFANAASWLTSAGKNIIQGLWNGIAGLGNWLKQKVVGFIADHVPGPIRSALGIASPSRVARQIGAYFGQGLGLGLDDEQDRVKRAAANLAAASVATPSGSGSRSGSAGGVTISFAATGDPLLDAILSALRKHVRVNGGNVQSVLGA